MNGLAVIHQARHQFDKAESEFQEALCIKESVLGPEHREIAALLNNLGALASDRGHHVEAVCLYTDALRILKAALGDLHPDVVVCSSNLQTAKRRLLSAPPTEAKCIIYERRKTVPGVSGVRTSVCRSSLWN